MLVGCPEKLFSLAYLENLALSQTVGLNRLRDYGVDISYGVAILLRERLKLYVLQLQSMAHCGVQFEAGKYKEFL